MRAFELIHADSFEEAAKLKAENHAEVMAGGSDLINVLRQEILSDSPEKVISLKGVKNGAGIEENEDSVTVRALTKLVDVSGSELLNREEAAFAQAAHSVATPLIRNFATVGGNICQDVRCWFYRYPQEGGGRMDCSRKGGATCYAINGENRYHSIYGGMKTHMNECSSNCPAHTDISRYLEMIRHNDWDGAAKTIMQVNPMPMLTSRVCPHPCQDDCNQKKYGECVNIHCVERTLGDYILANAGRFYPAPAKETGKKFAVVGAGPSGLACAYFLRSAGHDVTVIDAHEKAGGVFMYGIPHYRLPKDIVEKFIAALEGMGIRFRMNTQVGRDLTVESLTAAYDGIYLGTGAWKQPILGISGESLTEFGLNFLVEVNSYLKDKIEEDVVVCGGGNVAMDVALTAKRMGAKHVRVVCRKQLKDLSASREEIDRAIEEGVEFNCGWGLKGIRTDESGRVIGLEAMKCVSVRDAGGRFVQSYDENDTHVFPGTSIILATGQRVDIDFLGDFADQLRTSRGLIDANAETFRTKNEKIYAGGDVVTGPNIAIRAIHAGGIAAKNMSREQGYPITFENAKAFITFDRNGIRQTVNHKLPDKAPAERTLMDEDTMSLSMEEAKAEAGRCMNCGCYSVNASDLANAVVALGGTVVTTKKEIPAVDFFTTELKAYDMLEKDELVTAIRLPKKPGYQSGYIKDRLRPAIDFALLALAYSVKVTDGVIEDISLVLGGAAPVPVKLTEVEEFLKGKAVSSELAQEAGQLAVRNCHAMEKNTYKIIDAETMVRRLVESL